MMIHGSCMEMNQEAKMQFAWNILVCYYEDTGRIIPKCSSPSIRVCTSNLSTHDFDIYTQFYNHCDSFCFYRESKEWQSQTDASIHHLEESTQQTIQKLYFYYNIFKIEMNQLIKNKNYSTYNQRT